MNIQPIELLIAVSANWRLSSLLANEDGPFSVFKRIRRAAEALTDRSKLFRVSKIADGMQCEWCNSIWIGSIIALYFTGTVIDWALVTLALSTGTIFFKYIIQTLEQIRAYAEYAARIKEKETEIPALFSNYPITRN